LTFASALRAALLRIALTVPASAPGLNLNVFIGVIKFLDRKDLSQRV
jgi:hypothetical protein